MRNADAVLAAVRRARVGGAFWHSEDGWSQDGPVIGLDAADERAIVAWLAGRAVLDPAGAAIPDAAMRARAIAAIEAASYRDPYSGEAIDVLRAIAILALWRETIAANRPVSAAVGMAAWKRAAVTQFLWNGTSSPPCLGSRTALSRATPGSGAIAYWPSRAPANFAAQLAERGIDGWEVEDGFVRSSGLGAECRPPMSLLVDRSGGIHFDPTRASEVETILATAQFDRALLDRARRLRERIVAGRVGKYGVDRGHALPGLPDDRRIVLAVGQVEDDLSVVRGGMGPKPTRDFLARVRAAEPDAYIVYRPHPDVVTGLRRGDRTGEALVDRVASGGSLLALLARVDTVHVLSSLTGFEALLRGVPVTVHGAPFYSGWGLTTDLAEQPSRRARILSLDALVAGALILAPRYRDPLTELPCTPETLVERLIATPVPPASALSGLRKALGATRRTLATVERDR